MDNTEYLRYLSSDRWRKKAGERLKIDHFRCCMCGTMGTAINDLEVHHVSYRNIYNEDPYTDLVSLCRICHKSIHKMMERVTSPDGRRGWKSERIPDIHVFNISGEELETIEG